MSPPQSGKDAASQREWATIVALGVGQIVSWGMLTYTIAVIGTPIANDLAISRTAAFGAFSLALLVSGLAAQYAGGLVDRLGGRTVLLAGVALTSLGLATLALSRSVLALYLSWVTMGLAMSMSLYETAFASLSQHVRNLRRSITVVTLFGGFASTLFIPLTLYAMNLAGWRATLMVYAGLIVLINVPAYLWGIPGGAGSHASHDAAAPSTGARPVTRPSRAWLVVWLAAAFAAAAFITSSVSTHVVNLLSLKGLPTQTAVWVAALIGPMQVFGRVLEFLTERTIGITASTAYAFVLMIVAMALLALARENIYVACASIGLYGMANGVVTVARGAVPAHFFGRAGYGRTLGRIAAPALMARAFAPFALTLGFARTSNANAADIVLLVAAVVALGTFLLAVRIHRKANAT